MNDILNDILRWWNNTPFHCWLQLLSEQNWNFAVEIKVQKIFKKIPCVHNSFNIIIKQKLLWSKKGKVKNICSHFMLDLFLKRNYNLFTYPMLINSTGVHTRQKYCFENFFHSQYIFLSYWNDFNLEKIGTKGSCVVH